MEFLNRTELLVGSDSLKKINKANIILLGCGGVGGYVAEMLVRSGVVNLTIVDFDKVDVTNINRQIIALSTNVGQNKVDVLKERLMEINPSANIIAINERYTENSTILNEKFDYVIDAIDSVKDKVDLIVKSHRLGLKIVSAMGAGNRTDIPTFKVADIYKTYNDGLAKVMRKKLKENGILKHTVVFTDSLPLESDGKTVGSVAYYPAMCGCVISAFVINELIKGE